MWGKGMSGTATTQGTGGQVLAGKARKIGARWGRGLHRGRGGDGQAGWLDTVGVTAEQAVGFARLCGYPAMERPDVARVLVNWS